MAAELKNNTQLYRVHEQYKGAISPIFKISHQYKHLMS
jgi:hypothetical protein